jgi:hypothetical protein
MPEYLDDQCIVPPGTERVDPYPHLALAPDVGGKP